MSDLRTSIAAVQAKHHHWDYAGALKCACGETFGLGVEAGWEAAVAGWAAHVADALIAAGVTMPAPRCPEWVRFGGKRINCQGSVGHEGECW